MASRATRHHRVTDTNTAANYTVTARILHWVVAGMVVLQFLLASRAESADESGSALRQLILLSNHKSVGVTIFALVLLRLVWRAINAPPALPASISSWQKSVSRVSHWSLYALLVLMPLTGWLMSSASAYSVSWFKLFQLPDLVAPDPNLKETLRSVHDLLSKLLLAMVTLHIIAALKHRFIDEDGIMARMYSPSSLALFVATIALGAWALVSAEQHSDRLPTESSVENLGAVAPSLPQWQIDYDSSYIQFTAEQAGATFEGVWQSWSADIRFSREQLDNGLFDVSILTKTVETQDDDRDLTLLEPEWFDAQNHPKAFYKAGDFVAGDDGNFTANGQLTIKGMSSPVALTFTVEQVGDKKVLAGTANLKRLALKLGTGEWEDTTWVGDDVLVKVRVEASAANE